MSDAWDCLIVGGGAAGLTAAVYLGRYRRRALVIDAGASRLKRIPRTRNVAGFPDGIGGQELHDRLREHADRYGAAVEVATVERLVQADAGFEARATDGRAWHGRTVILATGARDVEPDIEGLQEGLAAGRVRYCPVCDGYETQGQRVAVLGKGRHGLREALFVAGFDNEVTWLAMDTHEDVPAAELAKLRERGVRMAASAPRSIDCSPASGVEVELATGQRLCFDVIYPALGLVHACGLATDLGARVRADGQLEVDEHMQTSVAGLYAAGDVAVDLNQISVATGHAAIAATAIHNRLEAP